jgi:hypothetical protein
MGPDRIAGRVMMNATALRLDAIRLAFMWAVPEASLWLGTECVQEFSAAANQGQSVTLWFRRDGGTRRLNDSRTFVAV